MRQQCYNNDMPSRRSICKASLPKSTLLPTICRERHEFKYANTCIISYTSPLRRLFNSHSLKIIQFEIRCHVSNYCTYSHQCREYGIARVSGDLDIVCQLPRSFAYERFRRHYRFNSTTSETKCCSTVFSWVKLTTETIPLVQQFNNEITGIILYA